MNPSRFIPVFLIVLALTTGCGKLAAQAPATQGVLPAKFQVDVGSTAGTSFSVALDGDHLVYTTFKSGKRVNKVRKVQPTAAQWQTFWAEMDGVDVWHWGGKYAPATAPQGNFTQWDVTLDGGGKSIKSEGSAAFPSDADPAKNGDDGKFTKRFIRFYNAVLHLVGETSSD